MKEMAAARIYSRALFFAVQSRKDLSLEKAQENLRRVFQLIQSNSELKKTLSHALIPWEKKQSRLRQSMDQNAISVSETVLHFLELLLRRKRLDLLSLILHQYDQLFDESKGILKAAVKSAFALDEDEKRAVEKKLLSIFKKRVVLDLSVHPELISGVVIQAGDLVLDGSLRSQLKNLRLRFEHGY